MQNARDAAPVKEDQISVEVTDIHDPFCFTLRIGLVVCHLHAKTLLHIQEQIGKAFLEWSRVTAEEIVAQLLKTERTLKLR